MGGSPVFELAKLGQCVWLDTLSRKMIDSGELSKITGVDGASGVTTNPSIFQKAISGSEDYDESLKKLIRDNVMEPKELFFQLAFEDVAAAADILRQTYEKSKGKHGFVSIEVAPDLAYDTEATIAEARWIFSTLGRKNIMVKVPATSEGLPAIEQLTADGVNVNVTLLFSVKRYEEVADAFMKGLERRLDQNHAIDDIASVASFFISRVDTLIDSLLEEKIKNAGSDSDRDRYKDLMGKAAVANAKLAYKRGEAIMASDRFKKLEEKGARFQRLLWGSTSTKNPEYSDIKYVQELIGPMTINTLPLETIQAFVDHGEAKVTIKDDIDSVEQLFEELGSVGIDIEDVAEELERQGVKSFADAYFALLDEIEKKRDKFKL
jgi:transaldolase